MAYIEVTASELRRKAEVLTELNGNFKSRETELESKEGSLCSMWEGEAKNAFHQAFTHDKTQMDIFCELISQYVAALYEIAQRYEEAERRNAELAAARSY